MCKEPQSCRQQYLQASIHVRSFQAGTVFRPSLSLLSYLGKASIEYSLEIPRPDDQWPLLPSHFSLWYAYLSLEYVPWKHDSWLLAYWDCKARESQHCVFLYGLWHQTLSSCCNVTEKPLQNSLFAANCHSVTPEETNPQSARQKSHIILCCQNRTLSIKFEEKL